MTDIYKAEEFESKGSLSSWVWKEEAILPSFASVSCLGAESVQLVTAVSLVGILKSVRDLSLRPIRRTWGAFCQHGIGNINLHAFRYSLDEIKS